jgi:sec-independent protein translocase protein TatB
MPSFQDSAVIFFIALLLFGPKKLPELARYIGKLMNEFRRASSEFRMQMEDEFRQVEQAENQKKLAAIEAAAPIKPAFTVEDPPIAAESLTEQIPEVEPGTPSESAASIEVGSTPEVESTPLPIATNGDLSMMPPATGLPVARALPTGPLGDLFNAIPHTPDPAIHHEPETTTHG